MANCCCLNLGRGTICAGGSVLVANVAHQNTLACVLNFQTFFGLFLNGGVTTRLKEVIYEDDDEGEGDEKEDVTTNEILLLLPPQQLTKRIIY